MPEPKRPLKVFLCHASTDKPRVRELYRYLKRRGIQPWFDEEHLVGGQDWQVEIPKALATSDAIIICLTKNSVDKEGYVQNEIKFALDKALGMPEGRIFLIPVKFEECEVPFSLSRYQWVDLTIESGYAKMMKALKFRASQLERSTVEISKKDVEEENLAREKKEHETVEHVERERKETELRKKQAREAREIEKRALEKKEEKLATIKPKTGGQVAYWFVGFIVLMLGIVFLRSLINPSSNPQPTPENIQTKNNSTSTPTKTLNPEVSRTKIYTPSPSFTPSITPSSTPVATPTITLTVEPTVRPVTAMLSASPQQGKIPFYVNFTANLKLSDGTLICTNSSECTYYWQARLSNSSVEILDSNKRVLRYNFPRPGSHSMMVTVCYKGMCDTTSASVTAVK